MQRTLLRSWMLIGILGMAMSFGQEEGSADLFTESYTDRFQELFFEALKQKGIENYDRAESLLQDAKNMDPLNPVLDYELARVLILQKRYAEAEPYALDALKAQPSEYWFLETFMRTLKPQSKEVEPYLSQLPDGLEAFHLNLARWYVSQREWEKATAQLSVLQDSEKTRELQMLIARRQAAEVVDAQRPSHEKNADLPAEGSVAFYENRLRELLEAAEWPKLQETSGEALEVYPLQPYFYYTQGLSLLKRGKTEEAVSVLESGEGLLLGETPVSRLIYSALAEAHTSLGNLEKANQYRNKLKSGS